MNGHTRVAAETDRLAAELRSAGRSYAGIAAELDRRGIPAPGAPYSRGWHATAVQRAIARATRSTDDDQDAA